MLVGEASRASHGGRQLGHVEEWLTRNCGDVNPVVKAARILICLDKWTMKTDMQLAA